MQQAEKLLFNGQADEALALFSKEAENGNGRAMYFLGFILEHGLGHTAQDEDKAAAWFDKGQKAGDALATLAAARWLGIDDRYHLLKDAFPKARAMAEDNDCFAKVELADMYLSGGIMINFEEGIHFLSQACAMGYWYALEKMGDLCQEGILVDKNYARAFAFYSKAAAAGHDHYSEYQLGCAWYDGIGTAMDREKGLSLLKKAWKDGSSDAAYRLALIAENGIGIPPDEQKAALWYQRAAEMGNTLAKDALGYFYEKGLGGLPEDMEKARTLYKEAAEEGDDESQFRLEVLEGKDKSEN